MYDAHRCSLTSFYAARTGYYQIKITIDGYIFFPNWEQSYFRASLNFQLYFINKTQYNFNTFINDINFSFYYLHIVSSLYFIVDIKLSYPTEMANPSFVMEAYTKKDDAARRLVNFRRTGLRYFAVIIACLVVFGCQYCFDNPSALETPIQHNQHEARGEDLDPFEFNLLYSLYAFPNIIVPLAGGMLIDSKGPRIVLILTSALCVLGQAIFGLGGFRNIWSVMLIGRVVFGLGGQVLHAAQNTIISRWFRASELSMVLGICISFPKMGSSLNAILSTKVSQSYHENDGEWYPNVGVPLLIGLGFMIVSLILAFILAYYDRKTEKQVQSQNQSAILSKNAPIPKTEKKKDGNTQSVNFLERSEISINDKQVPQEGGHLNFSGIKKLPITYWLLLMVAMLSEALFIPFLDNGNSYFLAVYKKIQNPDEAGMYLILPYVVSSLLVVPLGFFADRIQKRGYLLIGSTLFIFVTYSFMMYVQTDSTMRDSTFIPWIPVFLLGVCICIYCTIIAPTVPMICPPELLGTGFGMMEMLQNLALGLFPLLAGAIRSTQYDANYKAQGQLKGFHLQTSFFYLISCICVAFAIFLETADRFRGNKLSKKDFRKTYISKIMKE